MRSIMYVPAITPRWLKKLPASPQTIITLDLETPCPGPKGSGPGSLPKSLNTPVPAALRCTSASTTGNQGTNDDLKPSLWESLDGVTLA